jgi:sulfite exporter TauE/SafE
MCGPLRLIAGNDLGSRLQYQGGRLAAYLLLGGLAGFAGAALPLWAWIPVIGAGLLFSFADEKFLPGWKRFRGRILAAAGARPLFLGLGSGLLPCGLLHAWVVVAAASGHAASGALLLLLLWAGTLPALEASVAALRRPLLELRARFPRALPLSFLLLALLPIAWRAHIVSVPGGADPHSCHGAHVEEKHHHVPTP